jgi:hypothetical protein
LMVTQMPTGDRPTRHPGESRDRALASVTDQGGASLPQACLSSL